MPVYVRCNLSVYYETSKGKEQDSEAETKTDNISINVPEQGEDYTLEFPDGFKDNWLEIDGIYYYANLFKMVNPYNLSKIVKK